MSNRGGDRPLLRERVYRALGECRTATAATITHRLHAHPSAVRRALDSLWEEGLVMLVRETGRPSYWRCAS